MYKKKNGMGSHVSKKEKNNTTYLKEEEFRKYAEEFGEERAKGYLDAISHMKFEVEKVLTPESRSATAHVTRQLLRNLNYQQEEFLKSVNYTAPSENNPNLSI
jgi:hypothetical protein